MLHTCLLSLAAASLLLLAGCGPSTDPILEKPCAQRGAASVVVGTGNDAFEPAGDGVIVQHGAQGGSHIWIGLACKALGPTVFASLGIRDVETGLAITEAGLQQAAELTYDETSGTGRASGLYGYLLYYDPSPENPVNGNLVGREVVLWADVTDGCHETAVHGETNTVIEGEVF